jgi:CAAX protease family protein
LAVSCAGASGAGYLVVFLGPLLLVVAAEVLDGLLGARGLEFGGPQIPLELPWYLLLPALVPAFFVMLLFGGPLGEEIGWRGYALPRLQERYSAFVASLLLGAAWALWHLPLFFITGTSQSFTPLVPFLVSVVALAVLFTWVFNGTRGSLLVAVLFHGTVNFSAGVLSILPSQETGDTQPFLLSVALTLLTAAAVVLTQGPARLSRGAKVLSSGAGN